ncbi:ABC transporter permease subunit [Anoxybacteroides tepidamans]|uniref:ABC transporter permease subunit n=1 Tax=Anoxybacteroides tepidamans TaxID=265948 RepID=UPI000487A489|nr:ABC transporter permease subunit [Anoxybacillus tepidamans]
MSSLKFIIHQILGVILLLILAALPLHFFSDGSRVVFQPYGIVEEIKRFVMGLWSGESLYYFQGDRSRFLLDDLTSFFLSSYMYLTVSLLAVVVLALILGIWFWKKSEQWLNSFLGFIGFLPDFILILLLQLLLGFIYSKTGVKIAKVASFSTDDPAVFLPILTLTVLPLFYLVRALNEKTFEVLTEDYILTAKSKGLSKRYIYLVHVTSNVLPFLKADLYKIVGISISNLFIVEYLYNTRGLTELLFEYPTHFGYQYNLVVITLFSFLALYVGTLFTIKLFLFLAEKIFMRFYFL